MVVRGQGAVCTAYRFKSVGTDEGRTNVAAEAGATAMTFVSMLDTMVLYRELVSALAVPKHSAAAAIASISSDGVASRPAWRRGDIKMRKVDANTAARQRESGRHAKRAAGNAAGCCAATSAYSKRWLDNSGALVVW